MKDKIYYYDRNNVLRLTLNQWPYYSEPSDLKDWAWGFNEQFGRINSFRRSKTDYELIIGIDGDFTSQHDALCDIFSADVLANEPGYLLLRGWKLPCYIIEAEYEYFLKYDRKAKFKVRSINSTWIRTNIKSYDGVPGGGLLGEDLGRDYSYENGILGRGYNYGYSQPESHYDSIDLPGSGNGYEIMIYGPQVNPVIYLDNQPIQVNVTLLATERLHIVSNGNVKTIEILQPNGTATDAFVYRDKEHSPFLTLGQHTDLTFGQIRFDFTTIERRSEPTWT